MEWLHFILIKRFVYLFLNLFTTEIWGERSGFCIPSASISHITCCLWGCCLLPQDKVKLDLIITKFSLFSTGFKALETPWCALKSGSDERTFKIRETACASVLLTLPCLQPTALYEHGSIIWLRIKWFKAVSCFQPQNH